MQMPPRKSSGAQYIHHCLNASKTKVVRSFGKADRFGKPKVPSPDKFYQIPSVFQSKSVSPGRRFAGSFQRQRVRSVEKHYFSSSVDSKESRDGRARATTFGIGRQQYYRSKKNRMELGPGAYELKGSIQRKPFYMGRKISKTVHDDQPNCATYIVPRDSYQKLSTSPRQMVPKMKKELNPKGRLQKYDNRVPGPGSYAKKSFVDMSNNSYRDNHFRKKNYTSFGVGQKSKTERPSYLGPGSQQIQNKLSNRFSQFGNTLTARH